MNLIEKIALLLLAGIFFCVIGALAANPTSINNKIISLDNSSFPTIQIIGEVTDQDGNSISGLTASNFKVTENYTCNPVITVVSNKSRALVANIDVSGSMNNTNVIESKQGLRDLVNLSGPNDLMGVIKFNEIVTKVQDLTNNKTLLYAKIDTITPTLGDTAFYDSIYDAVTILTNSSLYAKAVIAFTDGDDNRSFHTINETIAYAKTNSVPVYTIGLGDRIKPNILQRIANETGGKYYFTPTTAQLSQIYSQISQNLTSQYMITYISCSPCGNSSFRNVTVDVNYLNLTASDTKGYMAPTIQCNNTTPVPTTQPPTTVPTTQPPTQSPTRLPVPTPTPCMSWCGCKNDTDTYQTFGTSIQP